MPTYNAGTSGGLKAVLVTPVLTTDTVTYSGSTVAIASITKWDFADSPEGQLPESITLESGANAQGLLYPVPLRGGTARYTVEIQGQHDQNPLSSTTFGNGCFVVADFLIKKSTAFGYTGCNGRISNYRITGVDVKGSVVMFSCTFSGSGAPPVPA